MKDSDYEEILLQSNARPEFIASEFAEVIRSLLRAVAANDPIRSVMSGSEKMDWIMKLVERCPQPIDWYFVFRAAVQEINDLQSHDERNSQYIETAKQGIKYLAELSSTDAAAQGRASKRLQEFRKIIEFLQ